MAKRVQLHIRFGKDSHSVTVAEESTVEALHTALEPLTGIIARKQKLIYKGKVTRLSAMSAS
jgi:Ubiquitin family